MKTPHDSAGLSAKRYIQIDYAKCLGILLVVFGHAIQDIHANGIMNEYTTIAFNWIYSFHMPLFFILSGLGLCFKYCKYQIINYSEEIKHLAKRLLIPYCSWSIIYLIGSCLFTALYKKVSVIDVVLKRGYAFISMRGAPPLWFLAALFLSNSIFILLLKNKMFREKPLLSHILVITSTIIGTVMAYNWFESIRYSIPYLWSYPLIAIFRLFPSLLYVEIGYCLGFIWDKILKTKQTLKVLLFSIFSGLFILIKLNLKCSMNMHTFSYSNIYCLLILGVLGSVALIILCCLLPNNMNILAYTGKKSMDIMILHYPPMPILRIVVVLFIKLRLGLCLCTITIITTWLCLTVSKRILEPIKSICWRGEINNSLLKT